MNPPEAKQVQVVPLEITYFGDDAEVKERLLGCPIVKGDIVAIESMREFSYFRVEKTDSEGISVIMPSIRILRLESIFSLATEQKILMMWAI